MAQISKGDTFANGEQVTGARLNQLVDSSVIIAGAITEQSAMTVKTVASNDSILLYDLSATALRKPTVGDLLNSNLPISTSSVTGGAGVDMVITPASGQKVDVAGAFEADSINITGNFTTVGTMTVDGLVTFNATSAVKIPVGTTAQRPATAVAGQFRYNSTLDTAEVYSGTEWKAAGGLPFDATGGTITTVDGYKIHTFTTSGIFTPSLTKEGVIEVLIVAGGNAGGLVYHISNQGTGGNGGGALFKVIRINRNTAPIGVVIGSGGIYPWGTGTDSSFGTHIAIGGAGGAGGPSNEGGRGGFGSHISGSLQTYGGGGGGGGNGIFPVGVCGGGNGAYQSYPATQARANSGGGGGGSWTSSRPPYLADGSNGADGVIVIRYRVS